jgi:hypothetical protein
VRFGCGQREKCVHREQEGFGEREKREDFGWESRREEKWAAGHVW